jgi:hypothetical protein
MDKTKIGVAVVLIVVLSVGVGYAYITGMGPLEEDPTAGLEEPPETETTYDFGEVPETGGDSESGQVRDGNAQTNPDSDNSDSVADDGTDNSEQDPEGQSEGETDEGNSDGDGTEAGTVANSERQRTDESDEDDSGDGGDGDGVDGDGTEDTERRGTGTLQANAQTTYTGQPFVPELENMEKCGETCREATVALQNKMNVDAENVVVYVRLYAGDSTDSEDVVWGENRELGTLGAGEVYRTTESVDLTPQQANKVRETDGVVTAKATVESDQATATFVERDDVE